MKPVLVRLQVLRGLLLRGQHIAAGRQIECTAAEAALLLESGRAELVNATDFSLVRDAVRTEVAAILRREGEKSRPRVGR